MDSRLRGNDDKRESNVKHSCFLGPQSGRDFKGFAEFAGQRAARFDDHIGQA